MKDSINSLVINSENMRNTHQKLREIIIMIKMINYERFLFEDLIIKTDMINIDYLLMMK